MSVLMEFSLFPLDQGTSLSGEVAEVIRLLAESGVDYRLTAMGTIVETSTVAEALGLVERATDLLAGRGSARVYATIKLDIRTGPGGRIDAKVRAVEERL